MQDVVIYAIGSPIVVDLEESLWRAGLSLRAGVQNHSGEIFLGDSSLAVARDCVSDDLKQLPYLVPLFTPGNRRHAAREAEAGGFRRPFALIDPSVATPRSLRYGPGLYVNSGCSIGGAADFGAFVFVNRGATIGHHSRLGDFVSIGPGAVIGGQVVIGPGSLIGAGAVVLPKVTIGENAVIGAGAVVTRDVGDRTLVVGIPARVARTAARALNDRMID